MTAHARVLAAILVLAGLAAAGAVADGGATYEGWAHQLHDCRKDWGSDDPGAPDAPGHDLVSLDVREGPIPNSTGTGIGIRLTMEGGFGGEPAENQTLAEVVNLTVRAGDGPEDSRVLFATEDNRRFEVRSPRTWPDQVVQRTNVTDDRFYVGVWYNHHRFGVEDGDAIVPNQVTSHHVDQEREVHERDLMPGGYTDPDTGTAVEGCTSPADTQRYRDEDGYTVRETPGPPPVANFSVDADEPEVGDEIPFTDRSFDPNDTVESWNWSFGDGNSSTLENPTHVYEEPGYHRVTLVVTDAEGNRNVTREVLPVQPAGPVASFEGGPEEPRAGDTVYLNSTSYDDDGNLTHAWTFGDGANATGRNVTHVYQEGGTYNVTLNVTDEQGRSDEAAAKARILPAGNGTANGTAGAGDGTAGGNETGGAEGGEDATGEGETGGENSPPQARIQAPQTATAGEPVTFQSRSTDPDDEVVARRWDLGDGSTDGHLTVNHTYESPDRYNVTLTVVDDDGAKDTAHQVVTVEPPGEPGDGPPDGTAANGTGPDGPAAEDASGSGQPGGGSPVPAPGAVGLLVGWVAAAVVWRR